MINQVAERTIARVLGFGSAFIAVVVVTGTVTDPVNVTKLFALGGVAAAAFGVAMAFGLMICFAIVDLGIQCVANVNGKLTYRKVILILG